MTSLHYEIAPASNHEELVVRCPTCNKPFYEFLSPREFEVLVEAAKGNPNKIIALNLNITEHTVRNHFTHILTKLDCVDRAGALITAIAYGWLKVVPKVMPVVLELNGKDN